MNKMYDDTMIHLAIMNAFNSTDKKQRTLGGIARETGLPIVEVSEFINSNRHLFEYSKLAPAGEPLYSLKAKKDESKYQHQLV